MKKNLPDQKYYNIMTTEGSDEATILLYGYIGNVRDYYTGEQLGVTDIEFVKELEALAAKYKTINIRINSPGGEVFHGSAIVTAIRNCTAEVHTWIDGVAASMAGIIWMAGKKRHMAKNAMLMLHSASNICWGNAKYMREIADILDKFDESIIIAAADSVGMEEGAMKSKYFDYTDHWMTYNDVNAEGWLAEPDDYQAAAKLPTDMASMTYRDLVAFFEAQEKQTAQEHPGILSQVKAWLEEAKAALVGDTPQSSSSPTQEDMNIQEFKTSLTDGTLKLEDVKAHIDSLTPPNPAATDEPGDDEEDEAIKALRAENTEIKAMLTEMKATITAFGAKPGAGKSAPGLPENDLPTAGESNTPEARLKAFHEQTSAAADSNQPVAFEIGVN